MKRPDVDKSEQPAFHYHELFPNTGHKIHECETCTPADSHIYEPLEVGPDGKPLNPNGKFERYK